MAVKILVDSTFDFTAEQRRELGIESVYLRVHFGDEEYVDGVDISAREFYERLIESDTLPTTSQATPADFTEAFGRMTADGDDVFQFLDMFFVVVAPYLVRFQPAARAADAASAARARIRRAPQPVPYLFRKGAAQIRIPAAVGYELKIQFIFFHAAILTHRGKIGKRLHGFCPLSVRKTQ